MNSDFRLLMIGAMYENGGNTTHRFLDGHPEMFVYPFESQIGTRYVGDALSSVFPLKYRWPVFPLDGCARDDFNAIIDEEAKVRARTPHVTSLAQFNEKPVNLWSPFVVACTLRPARLAGREPRLQLLVERCCKVTPFL
jgi:hypothetical protein